MYKPKFTLLLLLFATSSLTFSQNVGIGLTNPDESALLDLNPPNKDKGLLIPRLTTNERDIISNPAESLLIFNTDSQCYEGYSTAKNKWFTAFGCLEDIDDNIYCNGPTEVKEVTTATGRIWMDRNLGSPQVATSSTDATAYGDYYQWGRGNDGHQCKDSDTTWTKSSVDQPGHNKFIRTASLEDWRNPRNDNLWQGIDGVNNPCPSGFRIPTRTEWEAEMNSWATKNPAGAFASPLKITVSGMRFDSSGKIEFAGAYGYYWASTIQGVPPNDKFAYNMNISSMPGYNRSAGFSVRCIKD